MSLSNQGPMGQKVPPSKSNRARLSKVAQLPCVICHEFGLPQASPVQVHHCIHGRYKTTRAPDEMTIPLCEGHHQGLMDTSKVALHKEPAEWRRRYGKDTEWLSWVEVRL
jgi:hypothetical protein